MIDSAEQRWYDGRIPRIAKKMRLFDYLFIEDYGKEYYLNILQIKRFCLLQFNIDLNEYAGSSGLLINVGHSSLLGFDLHIWRYSVSVDALSWSGRNLITYRSYRNECYTENADD